MLASVSNLHGMDALGMRQMARIEVSKSIGCRNGAMHLTRVRIWRMK